jgi:hypothetical protein
MAKEHCAEILITIMKKKSFDGENNLILACKMWLKDKLVSSTGKQGHHLGSTT